MTPEERVDAALRDWIRAGGGEGSKAFLATAIRAAENDALDRAANAVEDLRFSGHILEAALGKKVILALKNSSN